MIGPDDLEEPCPLPGCPGALYLSIESTIPLYKKDPGYPGAGKATYAPDDALLTAWTVICTEGHTVWTHTDQIRVTNFKGLTEEDEAGDYAPKYLPEMVWWR